ncbi:MAG: DUF2530 domain-containing protein [Frankiaceae bacterium]|jgi:hypothetical protein
MPDRHRTLEPLETPAAPVLVVGTALFALALVAVVITGGPTDWRWICLCGIALGGIGIPVARRMQRPGH